MWKITADCVYATVDSPYGTGRGKQLLLTGALLPDDCPELTHLISCGMVARVGDQPRAVAVVESATDTDRDADVEEPGRAEARAKLPEDGTAPDGRAAAAVWVEYGVVKGYAYDELIKHTKTDLVDLLKS